MQQLRNLKEKVSDAVHHDPKETWHITVQRGDGLKGKDKLSKSDAYVKLKFGGQSFQTKTIKNDHSPKWNETFQIDVRPNAKNHVEVEVYDHDLAADDKIGEAIVKAMELPINFAEEKQFNLALQHKDQMTGAIYLLIKKMDNTNQQKQKQIDADGNVKLQYDKQPQQPQQPQQQQAQAQAQAQPMPSSGNPKALQY
jgi:Ca2+-dependent lipid-binding protein